MGYVFAMGACLVCKRTFSFNPVRVPSYRVNGTKEPICPVCMEEINAKRATIGLPPFPIPENAYEATDEQNL